MTITRDDVEVVPVLDLKPGDRIFVRMQVYTVVQLVTPTCSACAKTEVALQVEERAQDLQMQKSAGVARIREGACIE